MAELPDFGTVGEKGPGPIETLVLSLNKQQELDLLMPELVARRIDQALVEAAASIHQRDDLSTEEALRQIVIVTHVGAIADLDEIVQFFDSVGQWTGDLYDNAWNLRNGAIPYKPGDAHYGEEIEDA